MRYVRRRCVGEGRSKAVVARLVGRLAGLSSERSYVLGTLFQAAGRELRSGTRGAEPAAWRRLAAIIGASLATAWGYAVASVAGRTVIRRGG
jgi:hypothetical protein